MTKIEWTDETWNPIVGCSITSPGCTNCYAMRMAARLERMMPVKVLPGNQIVPSHYSALTQPSKAGPVWTGRANIAPNHVIAKPLRWRKPRRVFVNSMGDLFHENVSDAWIDRVFAIMAQCPQHTFQVLTKRSKRMRDYIIGLPARREGFDCDSGLDWAEWPLPNVWLGVTAEDQQRTDERIPDLLVTPAAVRFVSCEPLLGPIDFKFVPGFNRVNLSLRNWWVICGGETGPGARPMHPDWPRSLRDQCATAGVPYFFKQWGEYRPHDVHPQMIHIDVPGIALMPDGSHGRAPQYIGATFMHKVGKKRAGRILDGVEHDGMPEGVA
jgi:protein gp37